MKEYDSNKSRREFLRLLGLTTLSASCGVFLTSCEDDKSVTINLYGTGTLDIKDWSKLKKDLNINLVFHDNGNDPGPVLANMITGTASKDYDIGGLQGGAEEELAKAKKIIPWDLKKIPNWDSVWGWAKDIKYAKYQGKQYGLPIVINADSIIYLPDEIGKHIEESNGVIDSYAAVFDERLKGKTAMEDTWVNSVIFTSIYLKESGMVKINDPGNLSEDELAEVMEFLIRKKESGQFLTFWQGWEHGLSLIENKEVYAMTGWEPIVYAAKKKGINVEYAVPKEGYEGWSNDLILHEGVIEKGLYEAAHDFANWELAGYYGSVLSNMRGYVVPNDNNIEYSKSDINYDAEEQKKTNDHVKNKFKQMKGEVYWQNVRPKHFKSYERWWSKLRNTKVM